jgi:hypothetical protein
MATQHQCAARAAVMHLAKQHWQAKSRTMRQELLQESSLATRPAQLEANSRAIQRALLPANFQTPVKMLYQQPAKPQLPELQD